MRTLAVLLLMLGSVLAQTAPQTPQRPRTVIIMAGPPPSPRRAIWVLQGKSQLLMYDGDQFKQWRGLPVPPEAHDHPENITISRGQVLYRYAPAPSGGITRLWTSDPRQPELVGGAWEQRPAGNGDVLITAAAPELHFSADGQRLYWFETRTVTRAADSDKAREAAFISWTTGLDGRDPQKVTELAFPRCVCETGVCSESCPEAVVWAPQEGVSDYFFMTRFVEGQIQSDVQETDLYRLVNGAWTAQKLDHPVDRFLDAADHGNLFVTVTDDGACCGWSNEGDDTASFTRNGGEVKFYDERQRFHNDNYDVSFYVADAAISPDAARIGYTIAASSLEGGELRVADSGKETPEEKARLLKVLPEMPRVEMVLLSAPGTVAFSVPRAELVGWLDDKRLLAFSEGELLVIDAATGKSTPTGIKAEARKFVFLQ